ncbi:MAG: site-2 protease family protein [Candidatus Nomurabacteria bacterium]|nr:site-2 protease family protein [Candidatus Nomurabacteria bacterium]
MDTTNTIFYIVVLIFSVIIHEISHGFMAEKFGDHTARFAGRLTLNPLVHLDLFGSIILPVLLVISHAGFLFGWAKPVPYNPNNLTNRKWGTIAVASAGILANLGVAIIFSIFIRLGVFFNYSNPSFYFICGLIAFLNLLLAFFNLMPFPPLDGSKILFAFLPARFAHLEATLERYSIIIFLLFIFFIWEHIFPAIFYLYHFLVGMNPLFF